MMSCLVASKSATSPKLSNSSRPLLRMIAGIAHGLAAALRLGLEDLPSQEKWAHACNTEDAAAIKETQSLHEQLLKTLKAVEGGMVDPDGIKGYKRRRKTGMEEHWVPMLETLNELFPDIAMVQLAGLDTAGYLLQFSIDQNNKLVEPSDLAVQTYYRLDPADLQPQKDTRREALEQEQKSLTAQLESAVRP